MEKQIRLEIEQLEERIAPATLIVNVPGAAHANGHAHVPPQAPPGGAVVVNANALHANGAGGVVVVSP